MTGRRTAVVCHRAAVGPEVAIRIDNSKHEAPAQFNEHDTLDISRRIEREKGSVYRINGNEVRARDVMTVFADARASRAA